MNRFFEIMSVVLPVILTLGLGYFSRTKKLINASGIAGIKALVMNFCLPAVLIAAFYKTEFNFSSFMISATMVLVCLVALLLGFLLKRLFKIQNPLMPFLCTGFEAGMMGYGLYAMLFGAANVRHFAMIDLGQVLFVFTLYMALLNRQKAVSIKQTLLEMVKSPVFLAILLGVLLGATGIGTWIGKGPAGSTVAAVFDYISAPTGMLMIFVVGYGLQWKKEALKTALAAAVCRLLIMAVLCVACVFVISKVTTMTRELFWAIVLMFSLPAPFVLPVFTDAEDASVNTNLSIYALLSILIFMIISVIK